MSKLFSNSACRLLALMLSNFFSAAALEGTVRTLSVSLLMESFPTDGPQLMATPAMGSFSLTQRRAGAWQPPCGSGACAAGREGGPGCHPALL